MVNTHVHLLGFYSGLFAGSHNLTIEDVLNNSDQHHTKPMENRLNFIPDQTMKWNSFTARMQLRNAF